MQVNGKKIKALREGLGKKAEELAVALDLSIRTIQLYEASDSRKMTEPTARAAAKFLKVSVAEIEAQP